MSEEPPRNSPGMTWTLSIVVVLMLYVGSIGPISYFEERGMLTPSPPLWIEVIYAPLVWLGEDTAFGKLLDVYAELWRRKARKP